MEQAPSVVRQREALGLRKLRHPRITRELEQFIEVNTPYFMRVCDTVPKHSCFRHGRNRDAEGVVAKGRWLTDTPFAMHIM